MNSKLGVIVTPGDRINEDWMGTSEIGNKYGRVGVIGLDADFEVIQTWIQKIQKE
jgi:hypothetical protein